MVDELIQLFVDIVESEGDGYTPVWDLPDDVILLATQYGDSGRWTQSAMAVVEYKGQLFGVEFEAGLTEMQEDEFYPSHKTIYPVERVEEIVYTYKKV